MAAKELHAILMAIIIGVIGWVGYTVQNLDKTMAGVQKDIGFLTEGLKDAGVLGSNNDAELRGFNTRLTILETEVKNKIGVRRNSD